VKSSSVLVRWFGTLLFVSSRLKSRKKVLLVMTAAGLDGGIERFNNTLISACQRLDVRLSLYSLCDTANSLKHLGTSRAASVKAFAGSKARFAMAIARAVWFGGYDVVIVGHVHFVILVRVLLAACIGSTPRCLLVAHGAEVWDGVRGIRRRALGRMSAILCVSRYTRTAIQQQVPELDDSRFVIFPNALSPEWTGRFATIDTADSRGEIANLPSRFMLSVARLDSRERKKGLDSVIEALSMLADRTVHYVIAGPGDDAEFLRAIARRCGVDERVHLIGRVSDYALTGLYRNCLAFVLPSAQEGFGIVFLEAMFFGALVVAADEKGVVDIVKHEQSGLLVPFGDVAALVCTLDRIVAGSPLHDRIRLTARQSVLENGEFAMDAFVRRSATVLGVALPVAPSTQPASATTVAS